MFNAIRIAEDYFYIETSDSFRSVAVEEEIKSLPNFELQSLNRPNNLK